jgi:nucleotide-binding universal stress UspA family protein
MYQHILIPTDGSELSEKAARDGVRLAKALGARVTGFYARKEPRIGHPTADEWDPAAYETSIAQLEAAFEKEAQQRLSFIESEARQAGVPYDGLSLVSDSPFEAIMRAATETGCDLIFMASHGQKGFRDLLLGSETQKVLTHCKIPVLVCR